MFGARKLECGCYQVVKKFDDVFSCFYRDHECERRTDRQNCGGICHAGMQCIVR